MDIVPGNAKCTHEDDRYFCVLPLIRRARVTAADSVVLYSRVYRAAEKYAAVSGNASEHPTAQQVLRSLPNYQLIFVFTAPRCTFVTLGELDAASWGGELALRRHRDAVCPAAKNSHVAKGLVELVRLDLLECGILLYDYTYHEDLCVRRIAHCFLLFLSP